MEAVIGSLDAVPSGRSLSSLVNSLKPLALSFEDGEVRLSAARLLAALVNKAPEGKQVAFLQLCIPFYNFPITGPELEQILSQVLASVKTETLNKKNAVTLFVWTTKALVMRAYSKVFTWIDEVGLHFK